METQTLDFMSVDKSQLFGLNKGSPIKYSVSLSRVDKSLSTADTVGRTRDECQKRSIESDVNNV
jgi:hypothetical protein